MNTPTHVHRNPRLLFWGRAFLEIKTLVAVNVLFYQHRGLTLDQVYYLSVVWSLTNLCAEVPSGYLADHIGRKRTLLLGVILVFIASSINLFAHGFWPFALSFVFLSAGFSCFSGTEEAMLYETLAQCGQEQQMNAKNGKQLSARSLPDLFVPFVGALVAYDLAEWQFQLLIIAGLVAKVVAFWLLSRLTEPMRIKHVAEEEIGVFTQSVRTIRQEPWLLKVALNKILVFIATFISWRISQPLLAAHGFGAEALGLFYVVFQGIEFCGGWFAGPIERWLGTTRVISWSALLMIIAFSGVLVVDDPWEVFALLAIALSANSLREPMFAQAVNARLHSHSRATTLSNLNMLKSIIDITLLFLAGWLSMQSLVLPVGMSIALCVIALVCFPLWQRELHPTPVLSTAPIT